MDRPSLELGSYKMDSFLMKWQSMTTKMRNTIVADHRISTVYTGYDKNMDSAFLSTVEEIAENRIKFSLMCVILALAGFAFETAVIMFSIGTVHATGLYMLVYYPSGFETVGMIVIVWMLLEDSLSVYGYYYQRSIRWTLIVYVIFIAIFPIILVSMMLWTTPIINLMASLSWAFLTFLIPFCWIFYAFAC
jgi:hypothetical protein